MRSTSTQNIESCLYGLAMVRLYHDSTRAIENSVGRSCYRDRADILRKWYATRKLNIKVIAPEIGNATTATGSRKQGKTERSAIIEVFDEYKFQQSIVSMRVRDDATSKTTDVIAAKPTRRGVKNLCPVNDSPTVLKSRTEPQKTKVAIKVQRRANKSHPFIAKSSQLRQAQDGQPSMTEIQKLTNPFHQNVSNTSNPTSAVALSERRMIRANVLELTAVLYIMNAGGLERSPRPLTLAARKLVIYTFAVRASVGIGRRPRLKIA